MLNFFRSGSLSAAQREERERQAAIRETRARIDALNAEPRTGKRDDELRGLHYRLSRLHEDQDGPVPNEQGSWVGNQLVVTTHDPDAPPPRRKRLACAKAERVYALTHMLRAISYGFLPEDGLRQLDPELWADCGRLTGLPEYAKLAKAMELQTELEGLRREMHGERVAKAQAAFEALAAEARGKAAHLAAVEAKLLAGVAKLLPLEQEYLAALQACRHVADRGESLVLSEPSLQGRRVASPASVSAHIGTAPGQQLQRLARKAAAAPVLRAAK